MFSSRTLVPVLAVTTAFFLSSPLNTSQAAGVTDSALYQITADINGELALLHEANGSHAHKVRNAPEIKSRLARHAYQKAREVMLKVQMARKLNGLPQNQTAPIPGHEITAADIKPVLDKILVDIRGLRPKFAVSKPSPKSPAASGKTANDIYVMLEKANNSVDGLDIPHVNPNQVLQVSDTIVASLNLIREKRGLKNKITASSGSKGIKPKAVYVHAFKLMKTLKSVSDKNPALEIPGGIALTPQKVKGRVAGNQVIDNLNNILADITSIKTKLGITTPTQLVAMKSGKKPSDVFDSVDTALTMAKSLN